MDIEKKLEDLGRAQEEFRKAHTTEMAEVKKYGAASAATDEKMTKLNEVLTKLEGEIDSMKTALNRAGGNGGQAVVDVEKKESEAYRANFKSFMRSEGVKMTKEDFAFARKSMSTDDDVNGGFFVTPEMAKEIVQKSFESSPLRALASVQTISSGSLKMIEDLDEAGSGWVAERGARANGSTPQIKEIEIPVYELFANPAATQTMLDDAAVNVESWLADKVSSKFGRDEATAFMSGNGVNKPKGILSYASGTSYGQVERQAAAGATAITFDDLINLQGLVKEAYQSNASWLINRLNITYIRKLKDGQLRYLWEPSLQAGAPNLLLGKPVYFAADLPSTITTTADTLVYGDIKAGYQIVDRAGIRVLRDPYSNKPYIQFYTTKRVGGAVKNFEAIKVLRQA